MVCRKIPVQIWMVAYIYGEPMKSTVIIILSVLILAIAVLVPIAITTRPVSSRENTTDPIQDHTVHKYTDISDHADIYDVQFKDGTRCIFSRLGGVSCNWENHNQKKE